MEAAALCPAVRPVAQAQCRLKPPQSPFTFSSSPVKYRPGHFFDSIRESSSSLRGTPPTVTWALSQEPGPVMGNRSAFAASAACFSYWGDSLLIGISREKPRHFTSSWPIRKFSAPENSSPAGSAGRFFRSCFR